jgi:hypothetical protein
MQPDDKLRNVYLPDPDELSTSAIACESKFSIRSTDH